MAKRKICKKQVFTSCEAVERFVAFMRDHGVLGYRAAIRRCKFCKNFHSYKS